MAVSMRMQVSLDTATEASTGVGTSVIGPRGPLAGLASLTLEITAALAAGLVAATFTVQHWALIGVVLTVWTILTYHEGHAVLSPARRQFRDPWTSAAYVLACVTISVGFGLLSRESVQEAVFCVSAATVTSWLVRLVRIRVMGSVRTIVVGDRLAVATLLARWAGSRRVRPVAAIVVEPDLSAEDTPRDIMGTPVFTSLEDAASLVHEFDAHSVIVSPGPGFTSVDFRTLSWALERTRVAVGVNGVLDSVAAHRITPGTMAGATVMDIRASRPTAWTRTMKSLVDRMAGVALLVVGGLPLLAMMAAIRLDSRGPAIFKQTRIGKDGRPFTVYKLRTMRTDAEQLKASMLLENESDQVLFKIRRDPRITRVGGLLRKSSMDELPQLLNVVKGEMSLIGPRPALPEEVAEYDAFARRRLAVKPGMTGLWQVSGRSDLSWDQAVSLDLHYADNWSLSDDLLIAVRTVGAVATSRGAY